MTDTTHTEARGYSPDLPSLLDAPEDELRILGPGDKIVEPAMLKTSIRLPLELVEWAKSESATRGGSLSELLRTLLERERIALADDTPVTTTRAELFRALSQALHPAA